MGTVGGRGRRRGKQWNRVKGHEEGQYEEEDEEGRGARRGEGKRKIYLFF
jgi:hypothetical protein